MILYVRAAGSTSAKLLYTLLLFLVAATVTMAGGIGAHAQRSARAAAELSCLPGLVHYFGFDEKEAGNYTDYVTNAQATCTGCPAPASSLFAGGQRFNGSSTGLDFSTVDNFQWGPNSSFTIELWVQASGSSNNQVLIGRAPKDADMAWWLGMDKDGYATFAMRDNLSQSEIIKDERERIKLNDGKWHHVALVRDGRLSRSKLYVDGFTVADFEIAYKGSFESSSPITIGYLNQEGMYRFNGTLDELLVYNRDLTEQEMRSRYNSGAGNYCGPEAVKPTITSSAVTYGVAGQDYLYPVKATGKPKPTFSLVSGPQGMTIDGATGVLRWPSAAVGNQAVRVKAANSQGEDEQSFTINVKSATEEKAGMRHHWMLQESSGSNFRDVYTPFDAVADVKKRPNAVQGVVGSGQRFNGKDTGLDIKESPNFNWAANETFSIELWVRTEASTAGNKVFIGRFAKDSPSQWWVGAFDDGTAAFVMRDIGFEGVDILNQGPKLNDGAWHQVVAVRDGASGMSRLFVDGQKVGEGRHVFQNDFSSRSPVNIGYLNASISNSYSFDGDLDEVKLFGRALSEEEIQQRYFEVYNSLTDFLRFEGRYDGEVVLLDWETQNEIETVDFEVQRSEDEETFTTVGTVKASGTTSAAVKYTFTDTTPLEERAFYRLKLNRANGTYTYSKTILVENRSPIGSSFRVYPNPAAGGEQVNIQVSNLKEAEQVTFLVTDVSGQRIFQEQMQTDAFGELAFTLPVGTAMRPGIYNLTIIGSNKTLSRKLVVAR
ncbi:LamG-like jellyroll fold domain-containing protein [Pontibacter roseus]|uniref:LamG-like jellyroll fold domain-containing protein n=1 Tax=Pontibacter roseus TaxID=336989 RepID=UPI001FE103E5|nr:LamG-like jellyroll fold domain-containing protein [Pontibacter roseus]